MKGRRDWLTSASGVVFRQRPVGGLPDHRVSHWRACHGRMILRLTTSRKLSMPWGSERGRGYSVSWVWKTGQAKRPPEGWSLRPDRLVRQRFARPADHVALGTSVEDRRDHTLASRCRNSGIC